MPVYDLTEMTFDPATDFLDVGKKFKEIKGREVTHKEPVLIAFYVSRWMRPSKLGGASTPVLDLCLQWVGQLMKGTSE